MCDNQTMQAAPVLITAALSDKTNSKPATSYTSVSNMKWHEQVRGDDKNKLEEKECVTGSAITLC